LSSTHRIEKHEKDNINKVKNRLKGAVGASISTSYISGSVKGSWEHQDSGTNTSTNVSNTDKLAWDATGGDTVLASKQGVQTALRNLLSDSLITTSSPAAWASTVETSQKLASH
jgi:hypothetical protein